MVIIIQRAMAQLSSFQKEPMVVGTVVHNSHHPNGMSLTEVKDKDNGQQIKMSLKQVLQN